MREGCGNFRGTRLAEASRAVISERAKEPEGATPVSSEAKPKEPEATEAPVPPAPVTPEEPQEDA